MPAAVGCAYSYESSSTCTAGQAAPNHDHSILCKIFLDVLLIIDGSQQQTQFHAGLFFPEPSLWPEAYIQSISQLSPQSDFRDNIPRKSSFPFDLHYSKATTKPTC